MTDAATDAAPVASGVLHYVLTAEDALAWERISPRFRRRDRVALGAAVFSGIGLIKVIGGHFADIRPLHSIPAAFALIAIPVIAVLWMQRRDRLKRMAERVPAPVGVTLEHDPQRVVERREDRREATGFGRAGLDEIHETPTHIFLSTGRDVVILPARAFADEDARRAFVAHWRDCLN